MTSESDSRRLVRVHAERVSNVSSSDFPGHYPGEDHEWSFEKFKKNLRVQIQRLSNRSIEFDVVGIDASIANAFRRIMIAEVPTICIENVFIFQNTSVIHDEVLAHRIGLVPLNVNPREILVKSSPDEQPTDRNTLVFTLSLACTRNPDYPKKSNVPYLNDELRSEHIKFKPSGAQAEVFEGNLPAPTNPNIVLAKLRPGQEIEMELHAVKGVGKDHAKFSPVATASYRLLPVIKILKPIPPNHAEKFAKCFSPDVIKIDSRTKEVTVDEKNVRKDTVSREVLRHPEFEGGVELGRVRDHFLFTVESESAYPPFEIFHEAIQVMRNKLAKIRKAAEALQMGVSEESVDNEGDVVMAEG